MKTIKHICVCAAVLMSLLIVNVPAQAAGNDWFEKSENFIAYYDGMGSVNFSLLVWTYGASYNHWAGGAYKTEDSKRTYVEYCTEDTPGVPVNNKKWKKLFYYYGDNDINKKEKEKKTVNGKTIEVPVPGKAWFLSGDTSYIFFTVPEGSDLDRALNSTKTGDAVSISHAEDERRSVTFNLRWAVPTDYDGKYLSIRVHVCDEKTVDHSEYTYTLITDEKLEEGISKPQLLEPMLFVGGTNKNDAGVILVPYAIEDELISMHTSLNSTPVTGLPNIGSIQVKAENQSKNNFCITAVVKRTNGVQCTLTSNNVTIPAYHDIQDFKVTPKMDTLWDGKKMFVVNSGFKLLTWHIENPGVIDAMDMDYFEIERAYKSDFSDAEQLDCVLYSSKDKNGRYSFIDYKTINNPYGGNEIYYRIRRMSASSFGWEHSYAKSYIYVGRVKQIGMNLCENLSQTKPYAAFRDCAMDPDINNSRVEFTGQFIWPDSASALTTAWDSLTKIEVVLWDNGMEAQHYEIGLDKLQTTIMKTQLIREFGFIKELPKTCVDYDVSVRLNTDATRFDRPETTDFWFYPKRRTQAVNMTSLKASEKDNAHPERTLIEWTADGVPDYIAIYRSKLNGEGFDSIAYLDDNTGWYNDTEGVPGKPYTYLVRAVTYCNERMQSDITARGTRSRVGYIDGFVNYSNGDKIADVWVYLNRGNTIIDSTKTKVDGSYKFSNINYDLGDNGTMYSVTVASQKQTFYPAKGGEAKVTLTSAAPAVHNVNFLSDSYQRYSGRVLYTGTTIPVRDAYFLINGQVAMSNNDTIRTDASGNFTLSVPSGPSFTLTVAKYRHTFVNNGKLVIDKSETLNAQKGSLDGIRFWDNTRTRLIGRLAGGDIQGLKPLGFGLSKNNLGDSLKLVFELEGDNIAHFVYDEKDLTKTTRDTTYVRIIGKDTLHTGVRFEEKRIIVRPDAKTGEYMIDLPPVKYRIVEASANGYATLFSAGRTSETKDLTNSLDTLQSIYDGRTNWYHDTYSVIYHAPASVKVAQLRFGMPMDFYGEDAVNGYTLSAIRTDSVYTHKDNKYVFGYPVYISGLVYGFRIYACEEYHYNNDINRDLDVVSLGNHNFTMYNGLLSGTSVIKGQLNNEGICDVTVDVANVSYDAVGTAALKHLDVSVNINGQDVHADPVKAFVIGSRITGADAMQKIGTKVTVEDVLRDPPGTSSYAWLERGATYTTSYNLANAFDVSLGLTKATGRKTNTTSGVVKVAPAGGVGDFNGVSSQTASGKSWPIFNYSQGFSWSQNYTYTYTTTERIQTSSAANVMGADATLYIGHTTNAYAINAETFNAVDAATLSMMKPAIDQGVAHVVAKDDKTGAALVVTQDLAFTLDTLPVRFVYTQDHIVRQILPQLAAQRASLLRYCDTGNRKQDSITMQTLADSIQDYVYWYKNENNDSVVYTLIKPKKTTKTLVNQMKGYNGLIRQWYDALVTNEYCELYGTVPQNRVASYSVSGNSSVTRTETGSVGYNYSFAIAEKPNTKGGSAWGIEGPDPEDATQEIGKIIAKYMDGNEEKTREEKISVDVTSPIRTTKWDFDFNLGFNGSQTKGRNKSTNRTVGFTLSQAEYGYIDVDVYRLTGTISDNPDVTSWRNSAINDITRKEIDTCGYECSDFIYLLRGGATRCQWIPERTTQFYRPGTLLDPATIKLDEAHLEVDQHEVSGVAADGVAVFDLQIWNESEAAPGVANGPHNFTLKLIDGSNPNGAKASIDGLTLTGTGRNFFLNPGQVIHKKLEVRRGALALDYDNLKLCLISDCDTSNYANQYISVHFLPASSPVRIATPDDKWVMNTNSPYDKQGYYLPVVIDGFDTEYANFDHIELQYKLSTQSESDWVTLCSYYPDRDKDRVYYDKASGNKQLFNPSAGRIDNIHFYGERDPMEQRYDLRAVSYCRYGTDYVTTASEPVSGIKDTRRPRLFGDVTPANGILTKQDYIRVPFSEPIAYNYLDEDNNFQVVGFKNKADYYSTPTLSFSGTSDSYARTQTVRDLSHGDFSIDLTIYPDADSRNTQMAFFSTGQTASGSEAEQDITYTEQAIEFGYTGNNRLYARICNSAKILSDSTIDIFNSFSRVTMTYNAKTDTVCLYVGTKRVGKGKVKFEPFAATQLTFGTGMNKLYPFKGRIVEARIWSKALTPAEIGATDNTCLSGYESGLLAYYPMTEGYGNMAYDKAHGANATLTNVTWNMPQGLALAVPDSAGVRLDPQWFNNGADADYTLIFCFRSNPSKPFKGDALLFGDSNAKTDSTNNQVGIFMTPNGHIELFAGKTNKLVVEDNYNDGAWHTLGLVVSHGFNYAHLYMDDKLKAQANGQFFGAWAMSRTFLGKNFNGYFDELSMWEFAMPQAYLSEFDTYAPNGQEFGLRCYLPFDQRIKNVSSIYETHYSPYNARLYYNSDKQEWYAKQDTVIRSQLDDKSTTTDVCPLIRNSEYEKMRFDWVGNNNELVINLMMPDAEVNHKNIFFSLRDVEDLQGNRLLNPIAWSIYLDRNVIRWTEQNLWIEKSAGMMDTVVYTTITNYSGQVKSFVISGLPEWLTVDEPIGTLQPQEERVLVFTVSGDLNAGDYVVPISLTDENNLTDQMLVNVRINAVFPNWSVPNSFSLNMNLIGTVYLQDEAHGSYVDTDTRDIVGAFYGNTCVGMQTITSKVGSTANLYLKVYGNTEMKKKDISLRLWQASTGKTFVLIPDSSYKAVLFVPDTVYGSIQKPVPLRVADSRVQNIPVYTGWNWISFYVKPDKINSSFITTGGFSPNDLIKVYKDTLVGLIASIEPFASVYTQSKWSYNVALDNSNIYMLHVSRDMVVEVRGLAADKVPELTFRHGWNNLPCLFEANTPLDNAMADYFNAAKDGDIITGYYQFAVFDNKQWVGSLESLVPGEGYMLYRQDAKDVTVHFYPSASAPRRDARREGGTSLVNGRSYSTAMPIVAALEDNDATYPDDAILRAYAHDELVGEAQAVNGMWFLLVHATDGNELTFTVTDGQGKEQPASNILNYGSFTPTGTIHNPYLIRFGGSVEKVIHNDILYIHRNGHVYDAQGAFVR